MHRFNLTLPRHAFGPRETARPGEIWRTLQDVAVRASSEAGYTPRDYREQQISWVMRTMTVRHLAEIRFGEHVVAESWISTFEREIFSNRQIRLSSDGEPVVLADQRWVHVRLPDLKPVRASAELKQALGELLEPLDLNLPAAESDFHEKIGFRTDFATWHSQMDPLAHANHPAYVDWVDEAWLRWLVAQGMDPQESIAVAESVTYRSGVVAPERVTVELSLTGSEDGAAFFDATIKVGDRLTATAWAVRRHPDFTGDWATVLSR
ncbi:MAG: acyl-[acyl-carrier-protein] thioesterase [Myxococcota bacterium]